MSQRWKQLTRYTFCLPYYSKIVWWFDDSFNNKKFKNKHKNYKIKKSCSNTAYYFYDSRILQ